MFGLTSLTPFAGGDEESLKQDLSALVTAIAAGGSGDMVLIMSPARAMAFPIKFPQQAALLTVLASASVPDTRVIAIDPISLVHGTSQVPDIGVAMEAVIHVDDEPLPIVESGTAAPVRSMFQTDCIAVRLLCDIAFAKRRSNAVAFVDGVDW